MIINNEFLIEAPVDRVWLLLNELETVVPCMPGAAYEGQDGEDHKASMKVKVGAISSHFKGSARFLQKDETTHTVVVKGVGKDNQRKGSATATVTAKLRPQSPQSTRVALKTDLSMTGPLAQFGAGVITDIVSVLLSQFTANLHQKVLARPDAGKVSSIAATSTMSAPGTNADGTNKMPGFEEQVSADLGSIVGSVALKYALRWAALPLGFLILGWLIGKYY